MSETERVKKLRAKIQEWKTFWKMQEQNILTLNREIADLKDTNEQQAERIVALRNKVRESVKVEFQQEPSPPVVNILDCAPQTLYEFISHQHIWPPIALKNHLSLLQNLKLSDSVLAPKAHFSICAIGDNKVINSRLIAKYSQLYSYYFQNVYIVSAYFGQNYWRQQPIITEVIQHPTFDNITLLLKNIEEHSHEKNLLILDYPNLFTECASLLEFLCRCNSFHKTSVLSAVDFRSNPSTEKCITHFIIRNPDTFPWIKNKDEFRQKVNNAYSYMMATADGKYFQHLEAPATALDARD